MAWGNAAPRGSHQLAIRLAILRSRPLPMLLASRWTCLTSGRSRERRFASEEPRDEISDLTVEPRDEIGDLTVPLPRDG